SAEAVAEPDNGPDPALMVASSADAAADDADEATPQPPAVASVADAPGAAPTAEVAPDEAAAPPVQRRVRPENARPVKFLADLVKAMQAAAEAARATTLEQVHTDSKTCVERIHTVSAEEATELKRRSDDDVAAIRDWSKAEIARIREETEQRIGARKQALERELEDHAALIERRIDRVQSRVGAFETEMDAFFQRLLEEEDPTLFASLAANLPEAPAFDDMDVLLLEPLSAAPVAPEPAAEIEAEAEVEAEVVEPADPAVVEATAAETTAADAPPVESVAEAPESIAIGVSVDPAAHDETAGTWPVESDQADPTAETSELDDAQREAAMAAIQAAAEAAERAPEEPTAEPDAAGIGAASAEPESTTAEPLDATAEPQDATAEPQDATAEPQDATAEPQDAGAEPQDAGAEPPEQDPRLAALGLTPDFAGAEAAAVADAASADEQIPEFGEESLAARLADLVPTGAPEHARPARPAAAQHTQVVVVGLVSVASIASFKRQLGRLPGVQSVGVSSGPDGEFVFSVAHDDELSVRDVIPTLPGFQARVLKAGDGIVNVSARDPESEA
ncbi:MAG TPA: hypothetical protein VF763_05995, partial [Candidatus Limnocylindrales bacterium]